MFQNILLVAAFLSNVLFALSLLRAITAQLIYNKNKMYPGGYRNRRRVAWKIWGSGAVCAVAVPFVAPVVSPLYLISLAMLLVSLIYNGKNAIGRFFGWVLETIVR